MIQINGSAHCTCADTREHRNAASPAMLSLSANPIPPDGTGFGAPGLWQRREAMQGWTPLPAQRPDARSGPDLRRGSRTPIGAARSGEILG
jgi:hypothetical protein